jgi:predicted acyltransferase
MSAPRALAVDALRGLAILGMVLVALLPAAVLPAWMYHAQTPPPTHETNTGIAGLTWPDLVFPFFIFSLGVAIPLSLTRRLEAGVRAIALVPGAVSRGLLLVFFALFRQHFDSSVSGIQPEARAWGMGLFAFAVLFLVFVRFPPHWDRRIRLAARAVGWLGALGMLAAVRFPDGSTFRPERIDIILLLLAYCALFGTLTWLATRHNLQARLGVLAVIAALRVAGDDPGWIHGLFAFDGIAWLYRFAFFQFLCAVIPGTIAGDLLLEWSRAPRDAAGAAGDRRRVWGLAGVLVLLPIVVLTGIQSRYVLATTCAAMLLAAAALFLARRPATATGTLIARLLGWGTFWLLLGLLLDPFDGGTKKVPETFAWFFQGSGLAIAVLVIFIIVADVLRKPRALQLLIDNGQNPMVAYVAVGMLVAPLLGLTGINDFVTARLSSPWMAFAWSVAGTLIVAWAVRTLTRRRLLWRS